ncbi:MAG: chloramphenicol acetyltransferase [Fulvivirga sp.]
MSKSRINIDSWERKSHFHFFKDFKEPFFGVVVEVDCTKALEDAQKQGASFFLYYIYKSIKAVNEVEAFRLRIEQGEVVLYDQVCPAPTVGRENGTFGFSNFEMHSDFEAFASEATQVMEEVKSRNDLVPSDRLDLIYYSAIPWINFTSLSHARDLDGHDCVPKISFGKLTEKEDKKIMPMSVHVHHALADGLHVGKYVDLFQKFMNTPL